MTALGVIAAYLALLLVLGLASSLRLRRTAGDYMLASHSIGPFLLLMSLFGTTMTAFALVGSTAASYSQGVVVYGMLATASGIMHPLCFYLVGVKLWSLGRRHGYTTQVEFFRDRLQSNLVGLLLFPVLVGLVIPYLLIGVLGAGAVVSGVTKGAFASSGLFESAGNGVPAWLASLVVCLVVLVYVFFGGMRGTAWANAFQTTVFMALGVITFVYIAKGIGGRASLLESMQAASAEVPKSHLAPRPGSEPIYFSYLLIPISVAMFPHVFQHWLTARSASTFKLPIVMHPLFIMIVWLPCVLIGTWAAAPGALPGGTLPNQELAALVKVHAGPLLGGLLTAGILAAIMSSLDSQFLCMGTMFTNDIVVHFGGEERFSQRQRVLLARTFIVVIVALTYLISLLEPRTVFGMAIWSFSGFTGLFPLVLAAVYWRRLTKWGALASIVTTAVLWGWMFWESDFGGDRQYVFPAEAWSAGNWIVIPPMKPVVTIFVASAAALVAVSLVTRSPSKEHLARFFPET